MWENRRTGPRVNKQFKGKVESWNWLTGTVEIAF